MKKFLLCFVMLLATMAAATAYAAAPVVNLTPAPAQMTVGEGSMTIPADYTVATAPGLPAEMAVEADKFVEALNHAASLSGKTVQGTSGTFTVALDAKLAPEGYTLKVTPSGAAITASTPQGLFYAFQTVKKILPANVMAGVPSAASALYALPVVDIADEPRYGYRGYMLDVSRHFFDVKEVKRILDIMSYYKLNTFHFHLTDDQGWRLPVDKYPRLTTVGATGSNSLYTDIFTATQFWTNAQYGPYAYTKDELRDIVAYAAELHIEVIPEVEMPGHFSAAIAAYPELSCNPGGNKTVPTSGGVYGDVLNIGSPRAVEFAKDVLTEVMEIFPSKYIHIGGDECPDGNWRTNAECQALVKKLGFGDNYRALQSHFTNEIAAWAREQGKQLIVWNESLTAGGTDISLIKEADPVVMCWTGADAAANKSIENGLEFVYTPQVPFYICRKYSDSDIPGPGYGDSDTPRVYEQSTPNSKLCRGVQGTFWAEHVAAPEHLEYMTLPRLMAIAESGWTPARRKNLADFSARMTADIPLLDLRGYYYHKGPKGITVPDASDPGADEFPVAGKWYTLKTKASDERSNKVIELLAEGSSLIGTGDAKAGRLWMADAAAEGAANHAAQQWGFEADPAGSGLYAMVSKASPAGSVNGTPTATTTAGRWDYDPTTKHYCFSFPAEHKANGCVSIASSKASGVYMNASKSGQKLAVNCYNDPNDGRGGIFEYSLADASAGEPAGSAVPFAKLVKDKTYTFTNTAPGLDGVAMADLGGNRLGSTTDPFAATAWRVASAADNADGTQTVTLVNASTGRAISGLLPMESGYGRGVTLGDSPANVTVKGIVADTNIDLAIEGAGLWPLTATSSKYPSTVTAGHVSEAGKAAPLGLGAQWASTPVDVITFVCTDTKGRQLGIYARSMPEGQELPVDMFPEIANHKVKSATSVGGGKINVVYERTAFTVTYRGTVAATGVLLADAETTYPAGTSVTIDPARPYFTVLESSIPAGTKLTPDEDVTVTATYATEAIMSVEELADPVDKLADGHVYAIKDNHADRWAYRVANGSEVSGTRTIPAGVYAAWQLAGKGDVMSVMNTATGTYLAPLGRSQVAKLQASPAEFTFDYINGEWHVHIGNMYWDGLENLNMVGWDQGTGHPYIFYQFVGKPYFKVDYTCVDASGNTLASGTQIVAAGEPFAAPAVEGLYAGAVSGATADELASVAAHHTVTITYTTTPSGIGEVNADGTDRTRGTFDIQGRRLSDDLPAPGFYIINGRKTLVK